MKQPTRADWAEPFASAVPADGGDPFAGWHALVLPAIVQLRGVAGSSCASVSCTGGAWELRGDLAACQQLVAIACGQMSAGMELHPSRRMLAGWGSAPVMTSSLGTMWRSFNSNIV